MTEIPEDVMATARKAAEDVLPEQTYDEIAEVIARTIMAERERAANIAKAEYDLMEAAGLTHPEDSISRDNCFARARSASAIERAIHQGKAALEDTER